jgi:hypothetical protein
MILREVHIYLPHEHGAAIVAPMYGNMESLNYEQEDAIAISDWSDPRVLAAAFRVGIERFTRKDRKLEDFKRNDWPAFRASGCRSVQQFENAYHPIFAKALNEAELYYEARTRPEGEHEIELRVLLNRYASDEEIGRKILRLFQVASMWNLYAG